MTSYYRMKTLGLSFVLLSCAVADDEPDNSGVVGEIYKVDYEGQPAAKKLIKTEKLLEEHEAPLKGLGIEPTAFLFELGMKEVLIHERAQTAESKYVAKLFGKEIDKENKKTSIYVEWLPNKSLQDNLTDGTFNFDSLTKFVYGLAKGLSDLHTIGITFNDIHPGNICIASDGSPKWIDFGWSLYSTDSSLMRVTMIIMDQRAYQLPPENKFWNTMKKYLFGAFMKIRLHFIPKLLVRLTRCFQTKKTDSYLLGCVLTTILGHHVNNADMKNAGNAPEERLQSLRTASESNPLCKTWLPIVEKLRASNPYKRTNIHDLLRNSIFDGCRDSEENIPESPSVFWEFLCDYFPMFCWLVLLGCSIAACVLCCCCRKPEEEEVDNENNEAPHDDLENPRGSRVSEDHDRGQHRRRRRRQKDAQGCCCWSRSAVN